MKEKRFIYPLLVGVLLNFCNCNKLEILEAKQYITKTEQEESEGFKVENSNYAYVTNTNGIVFYKTLMDLKSKLKVDTSNIDINVKSLLVDGKKTSINSLTQTKSDNSP